MKGPPVLVNSSRLSHSTPREILIPLDCDLLPGKSCPRITLQIAFCTACQSCLTHLMTLFRLDLHVSYVFGLEKRSAILYILTHAMPGNYFFNTLDDWQVSVYKYSSHGSTRSSQSVRHPTLRTGTEHFHNIRQNYLGNKSSTARYKSVSPLHVVCS